MKNMDDCPSCGKNNWESKDYEIKNSYSEKAPNHDNIPVNVKRIVKQFTCKGCNYTIQIFDDDQEQSEKNSIATCGGEHGTAFSNIGDHSHEHTGNPS